MVPFNSGEPRPSPKPSPDVTGSLTSARSTGTGQWSSNGGTPVTVMRGESIETIARRHGVPAGAIIRANNLAAPAAVHPGQQLVIPRYNAGPAATSAHALARPPSATVKPGAAMSTPGNPGTHVVAPGETLSRISRLYKKPLSEIARANNISPGARLSIGDRLVIPGVQVSTQKPQVSPSPQAKPVTAPKRAEPEAVASANVYAPAAESSSVNASSKPAEAASTLPKLRWPANGRVIAGFGPTTNGQQNDGINIALPENTPVKAAEEGIVAYAGNELKGYGNLVLVRHPNGYVTAYAHAKELLVKRGDQVKRGQVIARSGQTGNVNAPQLHFEVRKGASPLDPIKFLNGA
jgi:murein DD-endopeptidase MepM/ murein hydrolase activator NlpD